MLHRNHVVQAVDCSGRNHDGEHHRETTEHSTSYEVWWENGGVPSRNHGGGEVEGNDRVNRKNQRCGESGEQEIGHLVVTPLTVATAPAEGEDAVEEFAQAGLGTIANRREVRHHAEEPENQ